MNDGEQPADGPTFQERVARETARRLDALTSKPGQILKWDTDGDGVINAEEWDMLRTVIESEVVHDLSVAEERGGEAELDAVEAREESVDDTFEDLDALAPVVEVIANKYEVIREIGHGAQATMWLARLRNTSEYVALKELAFQNIDSWKSVELFEREADALRVLNHRAIPTFVDSFQVDLPDGSQRFFLAQEFVSGESLRVLIARGERFTEAEVTQIAQELLEVLAYLHELNPPVVHRDLKPSNIIRGRDGKYSLVDFGGVQLMLNDDVGGSTVVGTTGYMPPEQLIGRAVPQSDLYALGSTLVHLLTHVAPSQLPQKRLRLVWRDRAEVSAPLATFIDACLQPVVEDRPRSASEARQRLVPTVSAALVRREDHSILPQSNSPSAISRRVIQEYQGQLGGERLEWLDGKLRVDLSHRYTTAEWLIVGGVGVLGLLGGLQVPALMLFGAAFLVGFVVMQNRESEVLEVSTDGHYKLHFSKDEPPVRGVYKSLTVDTEGGWLLRSETGESRYVGASCSEGEMLTISGALKELLERPQGQLEP